jgi:hypothetical protein
MRKILFPVVLLFSLNSFSQQKISKMDKAKQLIRKEFKETMNDYASYSPISYSRLDSLFTSLSDDEYGKGLFMRAMESKEKAGLENIEGLPDVSETIKQMEAQEHLYKVGAIEKWKIYQANRGLFYSYLKDFNPSFIGWKLIHKYRTKNVYNATILKEQEFRFNKDMSKLIDIKDIDN